MHPHRLATITLTTLAAAVGLAVPAYAEPFGQATCDQPPLPPECQVVAIDPGPGGPAGTSGGEGGEPVCRINGQTVPCHEPGLGWLHTDGCYHSPDPRVGPGRHWWQRACYDPTTGSHYSGGWTQRTTPPASLEPVVQQAVDRLAIPQPAIAANPALAAPQLVHVPVWWWIQPDTWTRRSATATIPTLTITAHATPVQATWHAGDGTTTTCAGPGTPWTPHHPPTQPSPTCGHTYTTTPTRGAYTLRAAITWQITWTGGGITGTLPPITTSTTTPITVTELRAVITN
jgi:hypothetical protein